MKKVLIFLLVPFLFQNCTDELSEVDAVIGSNSEYNTNTSENDATIAEVPYNSYKATYFHSQNVVERIEHSIEHKLNKQISSNPFNDATSAFWVGDFEFQGGDYEISVQSDKKVTMVLGDKFVIDDPGSNSSRISFNTFKSLEGVHRVLIFYNMDKSQIADMILQYYAGLKLEERSSVGANSTSVKDLYPEGLNMNSITSDLLPHVIVQWKKRLK